MKTIYLVLVSTMIGCSAPTGAGFAAEAQNNLNNTSDAGTDTGTTTTAVADNGDSGNSGGAFQYDDTNGSNTFDLKNGWATDYVVLLDPTFAAADVDNLTYALYQWEQAVPVRFNTWVGACDAAQAGQICIHNGQNVPLDQRPGPQYTGWTSWLSDRADITMYASTATTENTSPNVFYLTALHEEGHAQGLVHHEGAYIMDPCVNCYASVVGITADDANQWFTLRGYPNIPEDAGQ